MSTPRRWLWGVAALLLAVGAGIGYRQIFWQVYAHNAVEYASATAALTSFESTIYFWIGGLGLLATLGVTVGGALLLPANLRIPNWALALIPLTAAAAFGARIFLFQGSAVSNEENVYRFTAQLLAQGRLTLHTDLPVEALGQRWGWLNHSSHWAGIYPYGWPALLAIGYLAHSPGIVNPLLAAAALWLAAALARRAYGAGAVTLTLLFLATAPFFTLTAATDMSGPAVATGVLAAMLAACSYAENRETRWLACCGMASAAALLCQPQTSVALLAPWWIWLLWKERRPGKAILWIAPVVAAAAAILALNALRTGSAFETPHDAALRAWGVDLSSSTFGFGVNYAAVGGVGVHTAGLGILFDFVNLLRLNYWLLGWPLSLLLICCAPMTRATKLFLSSVAVLLAVSVTSHDPGVTVTGPSQYFETACLLVILAAAGADRLDRWYRETPAGQFAPQGWTALIAAILVVNLAMFLPVQLRSLAAMSRRNGLLEKTVRQQATAPAVIFVSSLRPPGSTPDAALSYVADPPMSASTDEPVLFLNSSDPQQDREVRQKYFPNRHAYRYSLGAAGQPVLKGLP